MPARYFVCQGFIGLPDCSEFLRIYGLGGIGVNLFGNLAVGFFYLVEIRATADAKGNVLIFRLCLPPYKCGWRKDALVAKIAGH